jgi:N-acetylmuramoyl-L-alanine amidase
VASREFPNTVRGVIFDNRWGIQFTPVANGTIYQNPTQESIRAAKLCLEGARTAGNSLYFLNPAESSNFWVVNNRPYVTTIGSHSFYA